MTKDYVDHIFRFIISCTYFEINFFYCSIFVFATESLPNFQVFLFSYLTKYMTKNHLIFFVFFLLNSIQKSDLGKAVP